MFELIQKPESLLSERERCCFSVRAARNHSRRSLLGNRLIQELVELLLLQSGECSSSRRQFGSSAFQCLVYFCHESRRFRGTIPVSHDGGRPTWRNGTNHRKC